MSFKEPTDKDLQCSVNVAWWLIALAILAPIVSLVAPHPTLRDVDLGSWFSRSGAITTVFALLAEAVAVRAKLSITPPGFGWNGLNEQRQKFIPKFNKADFVVFVLVVTGTLIWAYGDIPFKLVSNP